MERGSEGRRKKREGGEEGGEGEFRRIGSRNKRKRK